MKKLLNILVVSFFFVSCFKSKNETQSVSPKTLFEVQDDQVGMSKLRLIYIDTMLNDAIKDNIIPGAVVWVSRRGKIVYHKAFGMADNSSERKLQQSDIFRIASQSKAITSTAVMVLCEEGKFNLDAPISKYIPTFKGEQILGSFNENNSSYTTKPSKKQITIRHLLTHTSGLGYGLIDGDYRFNKIYNKANIIDLFTTENISIEDNIKKLAKLALHHKTGERFTYGEALDVL
ncbi:serine hydrolase domain-containing protein [Gelatiniphilus marinus]|uniref:Serine hydrolase domain-containing protein n=1 Tax=Gelatiniphilus marinus TaxID=1759464 RepID=A0ABW5JPR4_9FLAO